MLQVCGNYFKERYGIGFSAEAITWVFLANEKKILLLASFGFVGVVNCLIRNYEL
jgi:hypothetical protein